MGPGVAVAEQGLLLWGQDHGASGCCSHLSVRGLCFPLNVGDQALAHPRVSLGELVRRVVSVFTWDHRLPCRTHPQHGHGAVPAAGAVLSPSRRSGHAVPLPEVPPCCGGEGGHPCHRCPLPGLSGFLPSLPCRRLPPPALPVSSDSPQLQAHHPVSPPPLALTAAHCPSACVQLPSWHQHVKLHGRLRLNTAEAESGSLG